MYLLTANLIDLIYLLKFFTGFVDVLLVLFFIVFHIVIALAIIATAIVVAISNS